MRAEVEHLCRQWNVMAPNNDSVIFGCYVRSKSSATLIAGKGLLAFIRRATLPGGGLKRQA